MLECTCIVQIPPETTSELKSPEFRVERLLYYFQKKAVGTFALYVISPEKFAGILIKYFLKNLIIIYFNENMHMGIYKL